MKKLITFIAMICLLNLLAVAGLAGYLVATGRLDGSKATVIADLLRHQGTPRDLRKQVVAILQPPAATAPATGPASRPGTANGEALAGAAGGGVGGGGAGGGPATAEERIDFARQAMEQERLRMEAEKQNLRHEHELLERMQAKVEVDRKKVEEDRKAFEQSVAQTSNKGGAEAFAKTMALYDELKPKQLKDLFMPMAQETVAKYLAAMEPERAAKIISEFKTTEERAYIGAVLEQLRAAGTDNASGTRTTSSAPVPAGAALPAAAAPARSAVAP